MAASVSRITASLFLVLIAQQVPAQQPPASRPFEATYWKATELGGKPAPAQNANREAHLLFKGGSVSGSNGCNRITGRYELKGDAITFSQMAGTQMACIDAAADVERAFQAAIKAAARWRITGDRLELLDAAGKRVAAFTGRTPSSPSTSPKLDGTVWQLVKFQGGDDKTLTPDDGSKYTIQFMSGGQLAARIDCNRGRGTWKSSGENQITFGPLALTRAQGPPGSLHDQIVKQWTNIRSYVVKDGHLFLSLMADGGIYEFQPAKKAKPMRGSIEKVDGAVDFAGSRSTYQ
jgi:heat shock protein HslJ